ncbi:integrase arm-type DNA-binding domain-containing protein [Rhizobium laguerreae]|uniref:tyrosine-type recombinase/integrase n=1 Tax=Rhizobium laguerreae TaxID=1076926 RepID=UPI001C90F652|nr:site-specific integrase [Rhizobium laguerreae]MBY3255560.1 integrase arm-type DNA-binding domain-containing protein [Rhizobium laguerreae]MBY3282599.1 integrase arm-type DNA-binding domain-containing protein [Rhizobium laguerreae]MBY3288953.1 integrase arm-type DNA-binding domain-containing protein [Rhizobium laguerreae]
MASHTRNALTVKYIAASKALKLRDGGGLWLVTKGGGRYWMFNYTFAGLRREMGIGPLHTVGLADAREKAEEARTMVRRGVDPIATRKEEEADTPKAITFGEYADAFVDAAVKAGRWRGAKTEARWRNLLEKHAKPIRAKTLASVKTKDVINVLNPVWGSKQETAEKLREAIERVLDAAKVEEHRAGDNPAAWRGNLEHVLHKPNELVTTEHHAALPHVEAPAFMKQLAEVKGVSARALELCILTACRSGEVRFAVWPEFDLEKKTWLIPAVRMKGGKEHRVALSDKAVEIVKSMKAQSVNEFVFPGVRDKKPLSDASLGKALQTAGGGAYTVHGFRSTFRDWATEVAHAPREIAEAALAHAVGDAVERSYARSDALERRRALMQEWATHCCGLL